MIDPPEVDFELRIDQLAFDEFLLNFKNTIKELTFERLCTLYLYNKRNDTFMISFDKDWQPFIGRTSSYNYPEDRTYLKQPIPSLYGAIAEAYQIKRIFHHCAGGRLFIMNHFCYFKETESEIYPVCKLIWPSRKTAHSGLKEIYMELIKHKLDLTTNPKKIEEYCSSASFPVNVLGDTVIIQNEVGEVVEISEDRKRFKFRERSSGKEKTYLAEIVINNFIKRNMHN